MMKGQASLEYLILGVIALSMMALSLSALIGIREGADGGLLAMEAGESASGLGITIREICALGSGNGREARIEAPLDITSLKADAGYIVRLASSGTHNVSVVQPCACQAEDVEGLSGLVYVKNEGGKIRFRGR